MVLETNLEASETSLSAKPNPSLTDTLSRVEEFESPALPGFMEARHFLETLMSHTPQGNVRTQAHR